MKTKERNIMKKSLFLILFALIVAPFQSFLFSHVPIWMKSCLVRLHRTISSIQMKRMFRRWVLHIRNSEILLQVSLQDVSTDEMVVPTRGQDWDDGGVWRRLHLHSWTEEDGYTGGGWNFGFGGVNTANRLIYQFQTLIESGQVEQSVADAYIAELEAVRGFFYWQLIDLYGNVPLVLVLDFAGADASPPTVPRADVYAAIVSNLETAVPKMSKAVDGTTYGRMNYYAGQTLLAKLYLNAGVYSGTTQWDKVIAACDEVINSGKYSLESNYFANFNVENSSSKEFIFAIPYDQVFYKGFNLAVRTLHYGSQQTYDLTAQPWNGFCTLEEFYNSYDDADVRKGDVGTTSGPATKRGNFIAGYQYKLGGGYVMDDGFETPQPDRQPVPLLGDPDGAPLNFGNMGSGQPQINELGPQAYRQAGVRIGKWEIGIGSMPNNMSNDYAVFRYADVLLMKAEALWRKGQDAEALILVNQIRSRAGVPDLTSLDGALSYDMDGGIVPGGELFNEIGREMFAENHRRQDLIRWGFFTDVAKWALPFYNPGDILVEDPYTTLFPIHRDKLSANPNLSQNPGY
ncbi:MAG: RagB/SusD family nutrient uptake outer membrane protein [Chlorobi bacterium]|nr:RagB/SusD family nutrient uptake outer membrane protein [Chlorobiota bacterium]